MYFDDFELGYLCGVLTLCVTVVAVLLIAKAIESRHWLMCWLCNPHDGWLIEWTGEDGRKRSDVRRCSYRMARVCARELDGTIIGYGCSEKIRWKPEDLEDDDEGEEWKRGNGDPLGV